MRPHRVMLVACALLATFVVIPAAAEEASAPDRLVQEAIQKRNTGDATAALPLFEKAAALYREAKNSKGEAVALKEMGNTLEGLGEHRQAIERQRQALEIAERIQDRDLQARTLANLGISLQSLGQGEQALDYYGKSLAISRADDNPAVEAVALWATGSLLVGQGKNADAVASLKAAVEAARRAKDPQREDLALVYLGRAYSNLGQSKESIASYQAARDLAHQLDNQAGEATILGSLASEYLHTGELDKAADLSKQAIAIGKASKNQNARSAALQLLSAIQLSRSEFRALLDTSQELKALARDTTDPALEETAVLNLALAYTRLEDGEKASAAYQDLLALAKKNGNPKNAAQALQSLGDAASQKNDHAEAVKLFTELRDLAREIPDPAEEASALTSLGAEYEALDRGEEAIPLYQQALAIAGRNEDKQEKASALCKLGLAQLAHHKVLAGVDLLDQCCTLREEVIASWQKDGVLHNQEETYAELRKNGRAMTAGIRDIVESLHSSGDSQGNELDHQQAAPDLPSLLDRALARARRLNDEVSATDLLTSLSDLHLRKGDAAKAFTEASQALATSRALAADDVQGRALVVLAEATQRQGDLDSSLHYSQELLSLAQRGSDRRILAFAWALLGESQLHKRDLTAASKSAEQAHAIAEETHLDSMDELALSVLTLAASGTGDPKTALRWGEKWLLLARRLQDREGQAQALLGLAGDSLIAGDVPRALAAGRQGLPLATGETTIRFLLWLGMASDQVEDFANAEKDLSRALDLARGASDPDLRLRALDALAFHALLLGRGEEAAKRLEESSKAQRDLKDPSEQMQAELNLAAVRILRGDKRGAIPHYERSLQAMETISDPIWRANLDRFRISILRSMALATQEADKAIAYGEQARKLAEKSSLPSVKAEALQDFGNVLFLAGRTAEAEDVLRRSLVEWEKARSEMASTAQLERASALGTQSAAYDFLQQVLVARQQPEGALEIAERGRARAFVEALAAKTNGPQPTPLSVDAIRKLAKERNITLIEYSILYDPAGILLPNRVGGGQPQLEKELFVWVVKPSGEIAFKKVDLEAWRAQTGSSLAEAARRMRTSMGGRGRGQEFLPGSDPNEPLRRLYDLLIAPIAEHLPSDPEARIVFVPQGPLFLVPFPALRAPSGRYLLEDHTVLSAPSIDSLASIPRSMLDADWRPGEVLVAGNPTIAAELKLEPYNLGDLPESGKEAVAIAANFGAASLTGDAAGKAAILPLLPQRRLLHLATHGLLEGFGDPLIPGALVLAPGKDDNGLLTAREILSMDLHADLAVLSACDTGGGRITSDGVIGLSRALLSAGVPNVVVSLWQVPDASTSNLMQRFYGELKANPDPGRALRLAMLATMKEHPRPGDWAAFTLIGGLP
ncbi:MAG TPA: CHAT domain-containing protein [Thermoanaerobaculia bacterium]|nr:CHAT domain-containing protein [Thermoanaerobaculia bacterium]